ncbi:hypothetical protein Pcinc_003932 [Petrolisthes cinctipes]|uniref:DUF4806 domain-containing protein n=1 Tax=Petrolisthes cinctipes TaxID=88211 RepID=A0AAE1KAF7_PETCI|nr:hypothetical protein Pcinc_026366 [Petrolisthes cinctipes]KAK3892212.1 hypothetical protein Pcinc_003932 [Petrolisthes cinctipes]
MSFVVVELLHEEAVEVVHKSWIVKDDYVIYCYWPPRAGASAKVKKEEMPDKEKWKLYEIRIFSFAETYTKALERAKRAENTSNIDTDPEDIKRRVIKKPAKFIFSEEEEADVEDNDYPGTCYTSTVAVLPRPPHHGGDTSTSTVLSQPSQHGGHTSTTSVLPQPPQHGEGKAAPSNSSRCPKRSVFTTPERFDTSSRDCSPVPEQPKYIRVQNGKGKSMSVSSSEGGASGPQRPAAASEAELADVRFRKIMAHIKAMNEKLQIFINIQQSRESREDVEDVLPAPVSSLEELADLCTKVADKTFKKKLTQYLSALGGHSLGNTVRRIFRQLGTNSVWSYYSLKGKKGKKAFADIPLCSVVIKACLTSYTKAKMSEVEDEISEALKHAPKRKGGSKYKESEPKRRQQCSAQESSDSDD